MRLWRSQKGDISEKIPPDFAVGKYLATAPNRNRCRLAYAPEKGDRYGRIISVQTGLSLRSLFV